MKPLLKRIPIGKGRILGIALAGFIVVSAIGVTTGNEVDRAAIGAATITQASRSLTLKVRTDRPVRLRKLIRQPDISSKASRYLCLEGNHHGEEQVTRICLGGRSSSGRLIGVSQWSADGDPISRKTISATVKRAGPRKLVATFMAKDAGLDPGLWAWRVSLAEGVCDGGGERRGCAVFFPATGRSTIRIRRAIPVGCRGGNGQMVLHGPRRGKRVALTFDDGPGPDTALILKRLRRFKVKATFFMLGMQVNSLPGLARKVLAEGHEIANHSSVHEIRPSYRDISAANRDIRQKTGFRPCLFRPPYGATSRTLNRAVKRSRMKIVIWDVDTVDWDLPGAGKIHRRITSGVRPGSIVLMHDGGGPREQTANALPGAIRTLRRRGYRFVTVSELLGNQLIYRTQ